MIGLRYQLKSVLHDKFCVMTFLLPIVVAAALHFVGAIDFSALGELHFGVLKGDLPAQTITWLKRRAGADKFLALREEEVFQIYFAGSEFLVICEISKGHFLTS